MNVKRDHGYTKLFAQGETQVTRAVGYDSNLTHQQSLTSQNVWIVRLAAGQDLDLLTGILSLNAFSRVLDVSRADAFANVDRDDLGRVGGQCSKTEEHAFDQ